MIVMGWAELIGKGYYDKLIVILFKDRNFSWR